jgi:hypothetical protein
VQITKIKKLGIRREKRKIEEIFFVWTFARTNHNEQPNISDFSIWIEPSAGGTEYNKRDIPTTGPASMQTKERQGGLVLWRPVHDQPDQIGSGGAETEDQL